MLITNVLDIPFLVKKKVARVSSENVLQNMSQHGFHDEGASWIVPYAVTSSSISYIHIAQVGFCCVPRRDITDCINYHM